VTAARELSTVDKTIVIAAVVAGWTLFWCCLAAWFAAPDPTPEYEDEEQP
jgi:hypothetical protein